MADDGVEVGGASCCRFKIPTIPTKWLLFIDFAFTFGTSIVYLADIVTDVVTLKMYWDREWYYAFGFSIGFIIAPSILLAILECQFLIKTYGKNTKWSTVLIRTLLNIPFQLTVIWYHFKLSHRYLKVWRDHIREKDKRPTTEEVHKMSMSNLADVDDRANTIERRPITSKEVPIADISVPPGAYDGNTDHTWWKQLTREEWLSHLNKMKLTESMLESLPQLLINLYLIVKYTDTPVIQYLSATLSYLSLCGGIVRYDKTRKDNEADRLMVDRTLLHSRAFATRLEWAQILFLSLYKGCFLAARILVFVYFTVYFQVYVLVFVFIHWAVLMGYLVYLWYPSDLHKKTRELVQADYKFRAYMFLSQDFISVFHNSLVGIFISVRPRNYAFLGQPYCYLFWFYFAYVIENIVLFLLPGVYFSIRDEESKLVQYQYYIVLIFELLLNVFGAVLCALYYFSIHKMSIYTRNAYPPFSKLQATGLCCCCDLTPPAPKYWTVCKQAETSEIFYLRREKLNEYKSGYTTVVRVDRKRGRNLECFIDERGKIFYAPRGKLFKKLPSHEEEELVNLRKEVHLDRETRSSRRPESSQPTYHNERLVGEEPPVVDDRKESTPLVTSLPSPPPLPRTPPTASTPAEKRSVHDSTRSKRSNQSSLKQNTQSTIPQRLTKGPSLNESARSSKGSSKRHGSNKAPLTSELGQGKSRPEELQHVGSQRNSLSTSSRPSRCSERSLRSNRSPSPKQSKNSDTPPKDQMSPAKEEGQVSSTMPSISLIPNQCVHDTNSSHRDNTKRLHCEKSQGFSTEGMWKQHKKNDHALHRDSDGQKLPKIPNHSGDKSSSREPRPKSRRSLDKGDQHKSKSHRRDSERHSRRSHSSKDRHQESGRSKRDFDIKSQNHDGDHGEVSPMGDPVGQTWI